MLQPIVKRIRIKSKIKSFISREYEKKSVNKHKVFYDTMKNHGGPLIMAKRERKGYRTKRVDENRSTAR